MKEEKMNNVKNDNTNKEEIDELHSQIKQLKSQIEGYEKLIFKLKHENIQLRKHVDSLEEKILLNEIKEKYPEMLGSSE